MDFQKTAFKNKIVFKIKKEIIDDNLTKKILSRISKNKKTGLDMSFVKAIQSKLFINALLKNQFKLFNLKSEILTYLCLILKDGFLRSYMNINDFEQNKRELVKRKFTAV